MDTWRCRGVRFRRVPTPGGVGGGVGIPTLTPQLGVGVGFRRVPTPAGVGASDSDGS